MCTTFEELQTLLRMTSALFTELMTRGMGTTIKELQAVTMLRMTRALLMKLMKTLTFIN